MLKKSKLFLIYSLLFVFGVFVANFLFKFINFDEFYLFIILLFLLVLSILLKIIWYNQKASLIIFGLFFLLLGLWRFGLSLPKINESHISYYNNEKVEFTQHHFFEDSQKSGTGFIGQVINEPDIRITHRKLTIGNINFKQNDLTGKILINAPNYPVYNYGDWLRISCALQTPDKIEEFDYGKYLAVKNIYSVCYQLDEINLLNITQLTTWQKFRSYILGIKYKTKKIIDQTLAQPSNEILSAMMLGLRKGVPQNILDDFRASGLSHIIAISGLHISIVAGLLLGLFIFIGFKRHYAFYLATLSLILFLILIGFHASSARAGIMGFVALWALSSGRLNKSINTLLLAASILLLINPQLLLADVGFQLSFLAVAGIIFLGDYINNFLTSIKIPESFEIKSSLMMTLSAQSMVLPLIVYYFGNLSLIAPLANILVLPVLPFIMILGFIQSLAGFIWLPLAKIIGYLTESLINWIMLVAQKLTILPVANFELAQIDLTWIIIIYMLLGWGIWLLKNRNNYER